MLSIQDLIRPLYETSVSSSPAPSRNVIRTCNMDYITIDFKGSESILQRNSAHSSGAFTFVSVQCPGYISEVESMLKLCVCVMVCKIVMFTFQAASHNGILFFPIRDLADSVKTTKFNTLLLLSEMTDFHFTHILPSCCCPCSSNHSSQEGIGGVTEVKMDSSGKILLKEILKTALIELF